MDLIGTTELKQKLDRGEDFKLVMCLGGWAYRAKHIPGSLRLSTIEEWLETLDPGDEIVLYDSSPHCIMSRRAYKFLTAHGYERVMCYAGGLEEWESVGYSLEGEQIAHPQQRDFRSGCGAKAKGIMTARKRPDTQEQ